MGSNYDQFAASLDRYADILDLTADGLGQRLLDQQARRIMDRAAAESGDRGKWKANQGKYGERKRAKGIPVGVGLRPSDSPMLAPENVRGDRTITRDSATMEHGATEGARAVGGYFERDRPFYGMTEDDKSAIRDECGKAVARKLGG